MAWFPKLLVDKGEYRRSRPTLHPILPKFAPMNGWSIASMKQNSALYLHLPWGNFSPLNCDFGGVVNSCLH